MPNQSTRASLSKMCFINDADNIKAFGDDDETTRTAEDKKTRIITISYLKIYYYN